MNKSYPQNSQQLKTDFRLCKWPFCLVFKVIHSTPLYKPSATLYNNFVVK